MSQRLSIVLGLACFVAITKLAGQDCSNSCPACPDADQVSCCSDPENPAGPGVWVCADQCPASCDGYPQCTDGETDCAGNNCYDGCCVPGCILSTCTYDSDCWMVPGLGFEYVCSLELEPELPGCCVFDPGNCGTAMQCNHGSSSCPAGGPQCDSNGCCTLACVAPDAYGRCRYSSYIVFNGCCLQTHECPANEFCSVDSDCAGFAGNPYCANGCCASCTANGPGEDPGDSCGVCGWGTIQCDGTCSDPNPPCVFNPGTNSECDAGTSCGNCGTWDCGGGCWDPCPNPPGGACGGCGTWDSSGSYCDDPCNGCAPVSVGNGCGNCGTIQCDGSCDDPCTCSPEAGSQCGSCGYINCDGSCGDPCAGCSSQLNQTCGNCGIYQCDGSCNDPCACGSGYPGPGSSCGVCGVVQNDCSCSDPCS
jgi:hypothetical protein